MFLKAREKFETWLEGVGKVSLQDTGLGGDTWPLVAPAKPPNIIHCGRKPGAASQ